MTEPRDWLTLIRTPGLGARRIHPLIQHFGSARGILDAIPSLRQHKVPAPSIDALRQPDQRQLEADLDWLSVPDHHLLTWGSEDYPPALLELTDPPVALFVVGDPTVLWLPQVAIVGSRNASAGGLDNARSFARLLASQGLTITSGLALGVDGAAHEAALEVGGQTIAVAATGLDRVYPARHRNLAAKIVENGAIVSEFPPGTEPRPGHFPTRNRIISGLSLGTLVVEASIGSGSLITARQAVEQGREVFAIPGSIHNPLARGCHQLIKQGAKLVESGEDLFEELTDRLKIHVASSQSALRNMVAQETDQVAAHKADPPASQQADQAAGRAARASINANNRLKTVEAQANEPNNASNNDRLNDEYQKLLEAVGYDPTTIDHLVERTDFSAEAVSSMLLILELDGKVQTDPGGGYYRCGPSGNAGSAAWSAE